MGIQYVPFPIAAVRGTSGTILTISRNKAKTTSGIDAIARERESDGYKGEKRDEQHCG